MERHLYHHQGWMQFPENAKQKVLAEIERTLYYNNVEVGRDELEKANLGLAKHFIKDLDTKGVPPFESIAQGYVYFTGDEEIRGILNREKVSSGLRACMDFSTFSFPLAMANVVNMILSRMFRSFPYHEDIFISQKSKANDFRLIRSEQVGGFPDLEDIDPETADYKGVPQLPETSADYRVGTKGNLFRLTRKMIINDSINLVRSIIERAGKAASRTHARYVWSFFLNNSLCPDGAQWFTAGHGNLGSAALNIPNVAAAITALANMTEPGSGEKLGFDIATAKWNLVVGISQWDDAVHVNQVGSYYTAAADLTTKTANPCYHLFGEQNQRIVICPFITDSDWGVIRDKEEVPIVEMSYLMGKEDPEYIVQEGPTNEFVLTQDRIIYKLRHEYGGALAGFEGAYKSNQ